MKKNFTKIFFALFALILTLSFMTVIASANVVDEGYCVSGKDGNGNPVYTNIKWEIIDGTVDGASVRLISFSIDKAVESTNTVLHARQANGEELVYWQGAQHKNAPWGEYTVSTTDPAVTYAIIGDGITEIKGSPFCGSKIETLEIPKSLKTLRTAALGNASKLTTVNVSGDEKNPGALNMKYVTTIENNVFEGLSKVTKIIFDPAYVKNISTETFKSCSALKEIEIPAGVPKILGNAFHSCKKLEKLTILGKTTELTNMNIFTECPKYPSIIGYIGSSAEAFAKTNGLEFVNIETGEVVHKAANSGTDSGSTGGSSGTVTPPAADPNAPKFDPTGATAHGLAYGEWQGQAIINTYWAFYEDTKTLTFTSATTKYNETGRKNYCADGKGWTPYAENIEHIIIGPYINKISGWGLEGLYNLKDIQLGPQISQIDGDAFNGCKNLTTIWREGSERIEGLADLTKIATVSNAYSYTAIKQIKLDDKTKAITQPMPDTLETIITSNMTPEFDAYCKENFYDLQDKNDPANVKAYYIRLDEAWIKCGPRTAYEFDEATGTLTIHGIGEIADLTNYYGGGSKNSPWFDIKQQIKHVVITEHVHTIGKYAFTECKNLETVQLPARNDFKILNSAFEKAHNLKSIYVVGNEPIEGTLDLRNINGDIPAWTFAYTYLIGNVIMGENVTKVGKTSFEENLGLNLKSIYGVPGSFAEKYAGDNGLAFLDMASSTPSPVKCTPPETTADTLDTEVITDTEPVSDTTALESESTEPTVTEKPEFIPVYGDEDIDVSDNTSSNIIPVVIIAAAVCAVASVVIIILIKKRSAKK